MSEPLNLRVDATLRRLLEHPVPPPRHRRMFSGTRAMRACTSFADAAQIIVLGLALRPLFPAAAETFTLAQSIALAVLAATLAVAARCAFRPPGRISTEYTHAVATRAAMASFVAVVLLSAVCWVTLSQSITPNPKGRTAWFLAWAIASSFGSAGLRYATARLAERLESGCRVLIIGSPEHTGPVADTLKAAPRSAWRLAGTIDDRRPDGLDQIVETIAQQGADLVVLALSGPDDAARIAAVCDRLADQPVRVSLALDTSMLAGVPRANALSGVLPLFDIVDDPHGGLGGLAKRCLDIGLGSVALLLAAPAMLLAALVIKLESPGPVLFRQLRFGVGSQPIVVLKFRSMRSDERDPTGARRTVARDPRVTPVGRFLRRTSIDELPQLINVLRGDMSLVGPRPHPLHMRVGDAYYFEAVARYRARHLIRPGVTGWAQVNGSRGAVDTLEKARRRVELDLYYLEHWSLWLDLRILLRTLFGGFLSMRAD